jgi:hypothetical protein
VTGDRARTTGVAAKQLTPTQNFRVQNFAGKVLLSNFCDQGDIPSLLIFQRTNYQHAVSLISPGATEGRFVEKPGVKFTKGVLFFR